MSFVFRIFFLVLLSSNKIFSNKIYLCYILCFCMQYLMYYLNIYFQGVNVPGFGVFSFSNKKIDVGNNKFILIQRPILLISEKLARTHGLIYTKHHISGELFSFLIYYCTSSVIYVIKPIPIKMLNIYSGVLGEHFIMSYLNLLFSFVCPGWG